MAIKVNDNRRSWRRTTGKATTPTITFQSGNVLGWGSVVICGRRLTFNLRLAVVYPVFGGNSVGVSVTGSPPQACAESRRGFSPAMDSGGLSDLLVASRSW